ncbi:MAG: lipoprotein [Pseudomonadota bacterium]|nr:lipoprotein [Pseudomonadota bacterium]
MKSTFAFLGAVFVLAGCGQPGPLYMPKMPAARPTTVQPPAARPGTPASQQPSPADTSPVPAQQ